LSTGFVAAGSADALIRKARSGDACERREGARSSSAIAIEYVILAQAKQVSAQILDSQRLFEKNTRDAPASPTDLASELRHLAFDNDSVAR
jgi:hypothetical protein